MGTWPVRIALLWIAVCGAGLAQDSSSVIIRPPQHKTQEPTGTISGTVFLADTNLPARLATIEVVPAGKDKTGRSFNGESDLGGHFTIRKVPEGKYYVTAQVAGYLNPLAVWMGSRTKGLPAEEREALESRVPTVYVTARQTATAPLLLERGAEIAGTVLYDDGSPAIGLRVSMREKEDPLASAGVRGSYISNFVTSLMEGLERMTDDRGHFRILGVAPGEYLVSVMLSTASAEHEEQNGFVRMLQASAVGGLTVYLGDSLRPSKAKTIKIAAGETRADADINIPLSKLHTIKGQVVWKSTGRPAPAAVVELLFADTREPARATVAVDGEFEIPYVSEDNFILRAEASAGPLPEIDFEVGGGEGEGVALGIGLSGDLTQMNADLAQSPSDLALIVSEDVSGITITVPDPDPKKAAAAPAETDTPGSPQ